MPNNVDMKICGFCNEELPSDGDNAQCRLCSRGYHFGDCSMKNSSWKGLGEERRSKWACASCRNSKNRSGSQSSYVEEDLSSLDIGAKLDKILEIKSTVDGIKTSLDFLSGKYDDLLNELRETRAENKSLKQEMKELKGKQVKTEEKVKELTQSLNDLDMYGRRVNMEIFGASVKGPSLQQEDTDAVVRDIAMEIGVTYRKEEIHKLHRLQPRKDGKPPVILIQFMSMVTRDNWLRAGKKARLVDNASGDKIFFNENLTGHYKMLLKEVKIRAKMHHYSFVWFQNGKICVRKSEQFKNIITIRNADDLGKIV